MHGSSLVKMQPENVPQMWIKFTENIFSKNAAQKQKVQLIFGQNGTLQQKCRIFKNKYGWSPDAKQTCMGGEVQAEEKNRSDSFSTPHDHAYLNFGL